MYCGAAFGWNVFTRKSARCDAAACAACDVCVHPDLDFARIRPEDLEARYAPYAQTPPRRDAARTTAEADLERGDGPVPRVAKPPPEAGVVAGRRALGAANGGRG